MSTTYDVVLQLSTRGDLTAKMGEVTTRAGAAHLAVGRVGEAGSRMGESIASAGARAGAALGGMIDRVEDVAMGLAKMGAAGVLAGAVYGVAHLNNQLEQTQISLAAIFQAQGFASTFEGGMRGAADQVAKMKQDVKALPGDLGQLSNIMKTIATPAAQAGAGADDIRKLAGNTMLIGQILGVNQEVAAREMGQLLSGRAGAHNILGTRLGFVGDDAKKLNAESAADRYRDIKAQMDKYGGAKDTFATSFVAQWTTAIDNVKYKLATPMTSLLFDRVKGTLAEVNGWFDRNSEKVDNFAALVGSHLANAWDRAEAAAKRFEPVMMRIVGMAEHLGTVNIGAMAEKVLPMALGMKLAPSLIGAAGGAMGKAVTAGVGMMSAGGAEGAAAAMANPAGLMAASASFLALLGVAVGAAGAVDNLTTTNGHFRDATIQDFTAIGRHVEEIGKTMEQVFEHVRPAVDSFGMLFTNALDAFAWTIEKGAKMVEMQIAPFESFFKMIERHMPDYKEYGQQMNADDYMGGREDALMAGRFGAPRDIDAIAEKVKPRASPSTTIQKVEIVVKGSDDPSRVARLTLSEIQKLGRHPTSSRYVANYTSPHRE